jgi:hypothetical protein
MIGLGDIVVGAGFEPDDSIDCGIDRCCEDDAGGAPRVQPSRKRQAVFARHVDVENGEIDRFEFHHGAEFGGGRRRQDAIAVRRKEFGEQLTQVLFVFGNCDGFEHRPICLVER